MEYRFEEDDEASRRCTWAVVVAVVLAATIGTVLLVRAAGKKDDEKDREGDPPAATAATAKTDAKDSAGKNPATKEPSGAEAVKTPAPTPAAAAATTAKMPTPSPAAKTPAPKTPEKAPAKTPAPNPAAKTPARPAGAGTAKTIEAGQEAERAGDLAAARAAYETALAAADVGDARALVESRLGDVMVKLVASQREMPEKVDHAIVKGDLIALLARKYGTTTDLIATANNISNPNSIQIGDRLRILDHPKFEIEVSKSENWLLLKMNGKFFKRYSVGTGKFNRTPVGTFKISDKEKNPAWWKDNRQIPFGDPENILGTRWMKIVATGDTPPAAGYGIHGTWDNTSLGQQSSAGCVRMANEDVEELFMLVPEGTSVTIFE